MHWSIVGSDDASGCDVLLLWLFMPHTIIKYLQVCKSYKADTKKTGKEKWHHPNLILWTCMSGFNYCHI